MIHQLMDYYETFTHMWSMIKLTSDQEQSGISKIIARVALDVISDPAQS